MRFRKMWKSNDGKHAPCRLDRYWTIHESVIRKYREEGFIIGESLAMTPIPGKIAIAGILECIGGLSVKVQKYATVMGDGSDPLVRNSWYSYQLSAREIGIVFRYDMPHPTHHEFHHVHRMYPLNKEKDAEIIVLNTDEECPHLSDVLEESRHWYYDNYEMIRKMRAD